MTTNERFQAGLQQAKDDVSELKSDAERKVAEAKFEIEVDRAKAKVERQLDTEAVKDERVFRAVSDDAKGFIETERAKDESVYREASADAKAQHEKLKAQAAELRTAISTTTGEARTRLEAHLDRVAEQIALSEAAMDEYYARRDEGVTDLS